MTGRFLSAHRNILCVSVLILAVLLPGWKLAAGRAVLYSDDGFDSDVMHLSYAQGSAVGSAVRDGELPLWEPRIYGGIPLMAWSDAGPFYPLNLLLFGFLPPLLALNWSLLIALLIAGTGFYCFIRGLHDSSLAALFGGITFALCGFCIAHLRHLSLLNSTCWLPWGFAAIQHAVNQTTALNKTSRKILWLAPVLALQILAGFPQIVYFSVLIYVCYFFALTFRKPFFWSIWCWFALSGLLGVGIGCIHLLPVAQQALSSQRSHGLTYQYAIAYSYDPIDILGFLTPYTSESRSSGIFWEDYSYLGIVPLICALIATFVVWTKQQARFFVLAALVAYLFVLGPITPVYPIAFRWMYGLNFFRCPQRALLIVDFSLCVLASLAIAQLGSSRYRWVVPLLIAATLIDLGYFQFQQYRFIAAQDWIAPPEVTRLKQDLGLYRVYSPEAIPAHIAASAASRARSGDITPFLKQREFLQPDLNIAYDFSMPDGYVSLATIDMAEIWGDPNRPLPGLAGRTAKVADGQWSIDDRFFTLLNLFSVKYVLTLHPMDHHLLQPVMRLGDAYVYRNPAALPRAFIVTDYQVANNRFAARSILLASDFDPSRQAILMERPPFPPGTSTAGRASISNYNRNRVVIQAETDSSGILVLTDTFHPGWKAEVDGKPTKVWKVNILQRGVLLKPGNHRVEFSFDPPAFKIGAIIAGCCLIVLAALLFLS